MIKSYVLDTNVLLHDPRALFAFGDNEVVIPIVVLDEIDKKKVGMNDEVSKHARDVIRALDAMRDDGNLARGVKVHTGGTVRVELEYKEHIPDGFDSGRPDNCIIGTAVGLSKNPNAKEGSVILVTKDINLRVKCDAIGICVEDYNADAVADNVESIYGGFSNISVTKKDSKLFKEDGAFRYGNDDLLENQYVMWETGKEASIGRHSNGLIVRTDFPDDIWGVKSRNKEQAFVLDALFNPDIKLVTILGLAGSGKTLMSVAAGVAQVLGSGIYKKIIMSRPVQPMGRDIGFLPGDIDEKMKPWMAPLQDNLDLLFAGKGGGSSYLDMQKEAGIIEISALTYIRGRSIPKSFIIVDEAQSLTKHEVKTMITRIGEGSKLVLTGDVMQIDNPFVDSVDNGLSYTVEKFKGNKIAAHVTLKKGERSKLATLAAEIM